MRGSGSCMRGSWQWQLYAWQLAVAVVCVEVAVAVVCVLEPGNFHDRNAVAVEKD